MPERLIVINGMAGSGKTTLARPLAAALGVPLIAKDAIKEALGDAVSVPLPTRSIGALATDALWRIVGMLDGTVMVESVWLTGRDEEWFRRGWESVGAPRGIELWCSAPDEVMRERFLTRVRHTVHDDASRIDDWEAAARVAAPITGLTTLQIDTSRPVDIGRLATQVRQTEDSDARA